MSRLQTFLVLAIGIGVVTIYSDWRRAQRMKLLPPIDWNAGLVDSGTGDQIRSMERRLDPSNPISWEHLAEVYRAFGMFPQGEYCYQQADRLAPADRGYLYSWAECFSLTGRTAEARKLYKEVVDERLTSPLGAETAAYCWLNIGQDYLREENVPMAIEALRKAGDIPKAKLLMSRVLIRSDRANEAVVLLDQLLTNAPAVLDYIQMKSWAEAALGNDEAAQDLYEKSLRAQGKMERFDPLFYSTTVKLRELSGGYARQLESLRLEQQGNLTGALSAIHKAIHICWTEDRGTIEARIGLELGHSQKAIALAEQSIDRVGISAPILDVMGVAYANMGEREKARQSLEQAASLQPRAQIYEELSGLTTDLEQKRRYDSLKEYSIGKDIWLTNGLSELGLKEALGHFEAATKLYDGYAHTWFYLGETRRFLGDGPGAKAAYEQCLQINPDDGRALRGLDRLKTATRS